MSKKVPRRYKTLLLLFLFLISSIAYALTAGTIEIRIWTNKKDYIVREPILVYYEVKNKDSNLIILSFGLFGEYFEIKDKKGRSYGNMYLGEYALTDTLRSNESYKSRTNLSDRYRVTNAGEYTIFMQTPEEGILPVARSNVIKVKIQEPTGNEKKALDMLVEADRLRWARDSEGKKDLIKKELGFQKYQELVDKYPNSIYAPLSLNSAIGIYKFSPDFEEMKKVIPLCKRLIENYLNSIYFSSAFMSLTDVYEVLKDKSGAVATMNELIERYPNTKISEEAKKRLGQIEKWNF